MTHLINFLLSLGLLLKNTGLKIPVRTMLTAAGSLMLAVLAAQWIPLPMAKTAVFLLVVLGLLYGSGILYREDALWLVQLWKSGKNAEKNK